MKSVKKKSHHTFKAPLIIFSGLIVSFFALVVVFVLQRMGSDGQASAENIEKMIKKEQYYEALVFVENSREISESGKYLHKAMVWMALAWDKQNRDGWRSYGTDSRDWLNVAEADSAHNYLQMALGIDPQLGEAHFQQGNLFMERGWFSRAEAAFVSALKYRKSKAEVRINLAVLYCRMGKYELARQELNIIARKMPRNPKVAKNLGFLYRFYLQDPQKAIIWLNRYLNNAQEDDRDFGFARMEFENLIKRYPEYAPSQPPEWKKKNRFSIR